MKILFTLSSLATFTMVASAAILLPTNFETSFTQTITNDKDRAIIYDGTVKFKSEIQIIIDEQGQSYDIKSNLFRWDYQNPTRKEVCTDGVQLIVIDHDLEQISRYIVDEGINLEEILKVATKINTTDYKAIYKELEYLITLDEKGWLKKIFYVDNLDNRVEIVFQGMQYETNIFQSSSLECVAPNDYDIIEG
ncbi:MAG: outer-membrane lipoprotein carrier protein LolA [Sulfurovaceae bacterium]|nr:outer-membrane lipoprotein carrier protein LolA [Sulfurovaceae bacterium]